MYDYLPWKPKVFISSVRHLAGFGGRAERLGIVSAGWPGELWSVSDWAVDGRDVSSRRLMKRLLRTKTLPFVVLIN